MVNNSLLGQTKRRYRNRVLSLRLRAGFKTQKEFAEAVGICPSVLCEIESNKRFLQAPLALQMRDVLGCALDDLYEVKNGKALAGAE